MAALAADRQRQMIALGVVFADRRPRLHEVGDDARIDDGYFGHRMRFGEGRLGRFLVADRHVEQHIAGMLRPDLRRALLHRIGKADDGRQRRPVDLDGLDRIAGLIDGVRDHEGNGIADMAHHAVGEDRIGRAGERIDFQVEQAGQTAEILDVFRRQDRADARQASGADGVDGEFRVGVRRAQHQRMHRGLRRVIVGIAALAANQRVVFLAKHALTDAELDGSSHLISGLQIDSRCILQRFAGQRKPLSAGNWQLRPGGKRPVALRSPNKKAPDDAGAFDCREQLSPRSILRDHRAAEVVVHAGPNHDVGDPSRCSRTAAADSW